ncbi:glycosyltransferase [Aureimonas phyllosphaerae]|uniref:glycosyltransferase n=1 Tax=Aureimonas phyllosphaerae TaxID=1166078 RepID=UPI003A5C044B
MMLARFLEQVDREAFPSAVLSLLAPGAVSEQITRQGIGVTSIDMGRRPRPRDVPRLAGCVSDAAPDLLHGWMYHGNLAAMMGSVLTGRFPPVIWGIHHTITRLSDESPFTRRLLRLSARLSSRAGAICYCSRVAADDHERLGFDPRRRVVIPNGTDCSRFKPSAEARARLHEELAVPPERLLIGHVARFHPMKDQTSLVRAIARLVRAGHDVQGVFVGDGHIDGPVRATARELGIDARITTLGVRNDLSDLLPGLDIYALSSAWGEACPLALGEAMASGLPPVTTAVGDCGWIVGPTGVVVEPADSEALAAGLAQLLSLSPDERRALGARARQRIIECFSLSLYVRRHLDLYERVLDRSRPALVPRAVS